MTAIQARPASAGRVRSTGDEVGLTDPDDLEFGRSPRESFSTSSISAWESGKKAHHALSEAAAEKYDDLYESANFATGSYMQFEVDTISRLVPMAPSHAVAADLGCGTGRDTFLLAKHFGQVYAYDFSAEMIRVASRSKLRRRVGNTLFEVRDVEAGRLPIDDSTVGMLNSGFGMGSFLDAPEQVFREVRRVLQPRGLALFSFYNADALVNSLDLEWRPALAARALPGQDALRVEFGNTSYDISARAYSVKDIRRRLEGNFRVLELLTFPTLTALFPQSLFGSARARQLCTRVDQLLASNNEIAAGPYIVAVCQKGGDAIRSTATFGYAKVLELLQTHGIRPEIYAHRPVRTMADVQEVLKAPPSQMVKSVLVAVDTLHAFNVDRLDAALYLVAVPADRKLDLGILARLLEKRRPQLRLATQVEVEELTGFQVGSIPPFGLPKNIPVIVDSALASLPRVWCGTGKSTESLHLSMEQLKTLATFTVADVSKR